MTKDKTAFTIKSCKQFKFPSNHLKILPLPGLANVFIIQLHYHIDYALLREGAIIPLHRWKRVVQIPYITTHTICLVKKWQAKNWTCSCLTSIVLNSFFFPTTSCSTISQKAAQFTLSFYVNSENYIKKFRHLLTNSSKLRVAVEVFLLHSRFLLQEIY